MSNIDKFNLYAGLILNELYGKFPEPVFTNPYSLARSVLGEEMSSQPDTIANAATGTSGNIKDTSELYEEQLFVQHTIRWLHESGYIRSKNEVDYDSWGNAKFVLTPKTLEALSIVPTSLETSIGKKLVEIMKNGLSDAAVTEVAKVTPLFIAAATQLFQ